MDEETALRTMRKAFMACGKGGPSAFRELSIVPVLLDVLHRTRLDDRWFRRLGALHDANQQYQMQDGGESIHIADQLCSRHCAVCERKAFFVIRPIVFVREVLNITEASKRKSYCKGGFLSSHYPEMNARLLYLKIHNDDGNRSITFNFICPIAESDLPETWEYERVDKSKRAQASPDTKKLRKISDDAAGSGSGRKDAAAAHRTTRHSFPMLTRDSANRMYQSLFRNDADGQKDFFVVIVRSEDYAKTNKRCSQAMVNRRTMTSKRRMPTHSPGTAAAAATLASSSSISPTPSPTPLSSSSGAAAGGNGGGGNGGSGGNGGGIYPNMYSSNYMSQPLLPQFSSYSRAGERREDAMGMPPFHAQGMGGAPSPGNGAGHSGRFYVSPHVDPRGGGGGGGGMTSFGGFPRTDVFGSDGAGAHDVDMADAPLSVHGMDARGAPGHLHSPTSGQKRSYAHYNNGSMFMSMPLHPPGGQNGAQLGGMHGGASFMSDGGAGNGNGAGKMQNGAPARRVASQSGDSKVALKGVKALMGSAMMSDDLRAHHHGQQSAAGGLAGARRNHSSDQLHSDAGGPDPMQAHFLDGPRGRGGPDPMFGLDNEERRRLSNVASEAFANYELQCVVTPPNPIQSGISSPLNGTGAGSNSTSMPVSPTMQRGGMEEEGFAWSSAQTPSQFQQQWWESVLRSTSVSPSTSGQHSPFFSPPGTGTPTGMGGPASFAGNRQHAGGRRSNSEYYIMQRLQQQQQMQQHMPPMQDANRAMNISPLHASDDSGSSIDHLLVTSNSDERLNCPVRGLNKRPYPGHFYSGNS